jgi:hypothetical protein
MRDYVYPGGQHTRCSVRGECTCSLHGEGEKHAEISVGKSEGKRLILIAV